MQVEAQNIITDVVVDVESIAKKLIDGPLISELLSIAALIKAGSNNEAIIEALVAVGISPTQAPAIVAGVTASILAIEAIIKLNATPAVAPKS